MTPYSLAWDGLATGWSVRLLGNANGRVAAENKCMYKNELKYKNKHKNTGYGERDNNGHTPFQGEHCLCYPD